MFKSPAAALVLITAFVVLLFNSGQRFTLGLMLKPMVEDLGWTRSTLSLAVTVFMILSALALPFAGRFVDRYGAGIVLGASVILSGLGTALMGFIATPVQAFVLYGVVFALGSAGTSIAPIGVLINRWFPDRIGLANSIAISGMGVGQLAIITILAAQLAVIGWRGSFLWLGLANIVLVLPLIAIVSRLRPNSPYGHLPAAGPAGPIGPTGPGTVASILRTPRIWVLFCIYAVCGFQDFFVATHIVAFALDEGVEAPMAGTMLAFMGLFGLAGVLVTGAVTDQRGPVPPTLACFLLRIALFGLILITRDDVAILVFALAYGFTFWITAPLTVVFAREFYGTALLGTVAGMVTMVHHVFGGIGAYVGAVSFDRTGSYGPAFWAMFATTLVATCLTMTMTRRGAIRPAA